MKRKIVMILALIFILSCCLLIGCSREVKDKSVTVNFQSKDYVGSYTGTYENGAPNGQGEFKYKKGEKYVNYKGSFKDGHFSDKGQLDTSILLVKFKESDADGNYKGDVVNGIPNGNGTFFATNSDNETYTYEGKWKNGIFNGNGTLKWDDDDYMIEMGNFKDGTFVPSFKDIIVSYGTNGNLPYTISDKANTFLKNHSELFPAESYEKIVPFINNSIQYKHLSKSAEQYGDQIVAIAGKVQDIYENVQDDDDDQYTFTAILVSDDDHNYYYIFYPGKCDVYEGDSVTIYGIPVGSSSYDNMGGGTTVVEVMAGCYIK